jgi:hypothetical protein
MPSGTLLANQHVEPPFSFSTQQLEFMKKKLLERNDLFRDLFPWDDINYGIDEQWAETYPYVQNTSSGGFVYISVNLTNHTDEPRQFYVEANPGDDILCLDKKMSATIEPGSCRSFRFKVDIKENAISGIKQITFDVGTAGMEFRKFCEALIIAEN